MEKTISKMANSLTDKERKALYAAISVLWLNDSSDYINGLWEVVRAIVGDEIFDNDDFNINTMYDILKLPEE